MTTAYHCATCTCDVSEPEPFNYCEINDYGCLADDVPLRKLPRCYPCGLPVCAGEECSVLTKYKVVGKRGMTIRRVRACLSCIQDRREWGDFPDFPPVYDF